MHYLLNEEQQFIVDVCRQIVKDRIVPVRAELDEKSIFPSEIIREIARADLFRLFVPEEYGGMGKNIFAACIVSEEISRGDLSVSSIYGASGLGLMPILLMGSEEQKQKYLPSLASGEKLAAFGITEAEAGSDAGAVKTKAVLSGDHYIINGSKQWITNAGEADIYTVFVKTDTEKGIKGISAFIVEKGTPGFDFGKNESKLGIKASSTRELIFTDCRIPKENLIGEEGSGFKIAMKALDQLRVVVGAQAVGVAQAAFEEALNYSKTRNQFGVPISSFQAIQHMLADMATQIEAARSLVYITAEVIDSGGDDIVRLSAMSKLFASDMAMQVTIDAVQIFGGYGYMKEYPVEKMMRDAKIIQIYEGTNQIQKNVIAHDLIKRERL
ncbi:MAG: acyl-CoA dehydrogenase family protein [Actinomycetota bacterium]